MNTVRTLDVSRFSRSAYWGGSNFDLASLVMDSRVSIETMMASGLIRRSHSFGYAAANPVFQHFTDPRDVWDNPYNLVWFVAGWGPEADRLIANAVRKLRPAVRAMKDTLDIITTKWEGYLTLDTSAFLNVVESVEPDGSFAWGDFPYGGAVHVRVDGRPFIGAVSALNQVHDDGIAGLLTSLVARKAVAIEESPFGTF